MRALLSRHSYVIENVKKKKKLIQQVRGEKKRRPKVEKRKRQEMHECVEFMPCVFSVFGPPSSSFFKLLCFFFIIKIHFKVNTNYYQISRV